MPLIGVQLLLLPLAIGAWLLATGLRLPLDPLPLLRWSAMLLVPSFGLLWWLGFGAQARRPGRLPLAVLLGCLWLLAGSALLAKLNLVLDADSTPVVHQRRIIAVRGPDATPGPVQPRQGSKLQCLVTLEAPVAGVDTAWLPLHQCHLIQPQRDSLVQRVRPGAFGWPWLQSRQWLRDGVPVPP